jgi:hypothetical protein
VNELITKGLALVFTGIVLGLFAGQEISYKTIATDCQVLGAFRYHDNSFACINNGKRNFPAVVPKETKK